MSNKPTNHATVHLDADSLTGDLVCDHGNGAISIEVVDGGAFGVSVWIGGDATAWMQFARDVGRIMGLAAESYTSQTTEALSVLAATEEGQ